MRKDGENFSGGTLCKKFGTKYLFSPVMNKIIVSII
jgi:hypothetical protein